MFFHLINILIPIRPCICQTINIPKENTDKYNILKIKFGQKGVFTFSNGRQVTRFHKDLMCVDSCFNDTLSTSVEPGEYLLEFNLDYKTLDVKDIMPYNRHIASYKLKLIDPDDENLTVMKTIMAQKTKSLYKNKSKFKELFVFLFWQ